MLKEKGRYYELPIEGREIQKVIYDGLLRIVFDDLDESYLDLHGEFIIIRYNQTTTLFPKDRDALIMFYDLINARIRIKEAKADKSGQLFLTFDNGIGLTVEDGPYENWHFTKFDKQNPKNNLQVHGGVGKTIF